jgi:hypothetical protein
MQYFKFKASYSQISEMPLPNTCITLSELVRARLMSYRAAHMVKSIADYTCEIAVYQRCPFGITNLAFPWAKIQ